MGIGLTAVSETLVAPLCIDLSDSWTTETASEMDFRRNSLKAFYQAGAMRASDEKKLQFLQFHTHCELLMSLETMFKYHHGEPTTSPSATAPYDTGNILKANRKDLARLIRDFLISENHSVKFLVFYKSQLDLDPKTSKISLFLKLKQFISYNSHII